MAERARDRPAHAAPCDVELLGDEDSVLGEPRSPAIAALTAPRGRIELQAALRRLSSIERQVLLLRHCGQQPRSYASVAVEIGVVKSTAFKAELRALAKLRQDLTALVLEEELRRGRGADNDIHDGEQRGDRVAGEAASSGDQRRGAMGPNRSPNGVGRTSND